MGASDPARDARGASSSASPAPGPTSPRLSTRAEPVDGGWVLNGQKVWTSLAQTADFGICLARSEPDAPKHAGITYFIVDMHAEGVDIRPLRELTGAALFNEVFLTDVFVPDDAVIGSSRRRLAHRPYHAVQRARVHVVWCLVRPRRRVAAPRPSPGGARGDTRASREPSVAAGRGPIRRSARAPLDLAHASGVDPGSGSSVRKLLGVEHEQRVQEMGLALYGADGAVLDGEAQRWEEGFLATRCLTIAGGTSEVQRNVIAERMLGQPATPSRGAEGEAGGGGGR